MTKKLAIGAVIIGFSVAAFRAEDWPQWGGPNRDHVSKEKGLLQDWPQGGPKRVWVSKEAGLGYSGISVVGERVYTMGARGGSEHLIALDAKDGKEVWAAEVGETLQNDWGNGPRGTPAAIQDRVYALSGQGTLIAAETKSGKVLWKKTMQSLGGAVPGWGYTESVLVENGVVYCTPGGRKGTIAALDAASGELKWQSKSFTVPAHYSSITPADLNGTRQLIQLTEKKVAGIDSKNGELLWQADFPGRTAVIPSPVVKGNNVYVTSGYGGGCKLLKIDPANKAEEVYKNNTMENHHGGVVLVGDHIYGFSERERGVWTCQEFATGKKVWTDKSLGKGAVTYADGRLYCIEEGKGTVVLAEASPAGWKEHGRFVLQAKSAQRSPSGRIWTHPVIANGKLYLRDQELLSCYDVSGGPKTASIQ
jgi:outer membrane protein assembly factor BamB